MPTKKRKINAEKDAVTLRTLIRAPHAPSKRIRRPKRQPPTRPCPKVDIQKNDGIVIAATSDIHGLLDGIKDAVEANKADILIIAGDIQPADIIYHCDDLATQNWFITKFFRLIEGLKCEVVITPGNHDFFLRRMLSGFFGPLEEQRSIPKNLHILFDSEVTVKGLRIYGTPRVPFISGHWCYEHTEEELKTFFAKIPEGIDILVSHSPPRIKEKAVDVSLERDPKCIRPFGSTALADAIERAQPLLVFCGHIHSGDHNCVPKYYKGAGNGTFIYNVSRVNERYWVEYPIRIVTLREKTLVEMPLFPAPSGFSNL